MYMYIIHMYIKYQISYNTYTYTYVHIQIYIICVYTCKIAYAHTGKHVQFLVTYLWYSICVDQFVKHAHK